MVNPDNIIMLQQVLNVKEHEKWEQRFKRCLKYLPVGWRSQLSKPNKKTFPVGRVTSSRFLHNTKYSQLIPHSDKLVFYQQAGVDKLYIAYSCEVYFNNNKGIELLPNFGAKFQR